VLAACIRPTDEETAMSAASRSLSFLRAALWLAFVALAVHAGTSHAARTAVLVFSPDLGTYDRLFAYPRVVYEVEYLKAKGYDVRAMAGTVDNITRSIADPQVRAISYFGHAGFPSMEHMNAGMWRDAVFQYLALGYQRQGLGMAQARQVAAAEVRNFGLELVRNHSCSSLRDTSMAHQFVRPGGQYHGAQSAYAPCPTPTALVADVQFVLSEYHVPGALPSLPRTINQCEAGPRANGCGTWSWGAAAGGGGYQAAWTNGAGTWLSVDRFDEAWVIMTGYPSQGVAGGPSAVYMGRVTGTRVLNGTVTWDWMGQRWTGTWNANWGAAPPTRGGGA
jgi:hypothetical protein